MPSSSKKSEDYSPSHPTEQDMDMDSDDMTHDIKSKVSDPPKSHDKESIQSTKPIGSPPENKTDGDNNQTSLDNEIMTKNKTNKLSRKDDEHSKENIEDWNDKKKPKSSKTRHSRKSSRSRSPEKSKKRKKHSRSRRRSHSGSPRRRRHSPSRKHSKDKKGSESRSPSPRRSSKKSRRDRRSPRRDRSSSRSKPSHRSHKRRDSQDSESFHRKRREDTPEDQARDKHKRSSTFGHFDALQAEAAALPMPIVRSTVSSLVTLTGAGGNAPITNNPPTLPPPPPTLPPPTYFQQCPPPPNVGMPWQMTLQQQQPPPPPPQPVHVNNNLLQIPLGAPPPPPPPPPPQTASIDCMTGTKPQAHPIQTSSKNLLETLMSKAGLSHNAMLKKPGQKSEERPITTSSSQNDSVVPGHSPIVQINKLLSSAASNILTQLVINKPPSTNVDNKDAGSPKKTEDSVKPSNPGSYVAEERPINHHVPNNDEGSVVNTNLMSANGDRDTLMSMKRRSEFGNKNDWQERIALEVKSNLKPSYMSREIDKKAYKEILKRTVTKITRNNVDEIHSDKIARFVSGYVAKFRKVKKKHRMDMSSSDIEMNYDS